MKAGAKRRRTKEEIRQEKLTEAKRLVDIEAKVLQFKQMQAELDILRREREQFEAADQVVGNLRANGMVRFTENNQIQPVQSWEENQQLLQ